MKTLVAFFLLNALGTTASAIDTDEFYTPAPLPLSLKPHADGESQKVKSSGKSLEVLLELSAEAEKIWLELYNCNNQKANQARDFYFSGTFSESCSPALATKIKNLKLQIANFTMTDADLNEREVEDYVNQSGFFLSPMFVEFVAEQIIANAVIENSQLKWPDDWSSEEIDKQRRALEILLLVKKDECTQWGLWPKATRYLLSHFAYSTSPARELFDPAHNTQNSSFLTKFFLQVGAVLTKNDIDYFKPRRYGNSDLEKLRQLDWVANNVARSYDNFVSCGRPPQSGNPLPHILEIYQVAK